MATFYGKVVGGGLNLRTSTSTNASSPIQIPQNTELYVSTIEGNQAWFSTSYGGYSGYVVAQYIAITNDGGTTQVTTASGSLNIRKTASTSASVLYTAAQNSIIRLLDYTSVSNWHRVSSANGTGWAQSQFLTNLTLPDGGDPQPTDDVIPAPAVNLTLTMSRTTNNTGSQVTALQNRLNQLGYYCGTATGSFNTPTFWAVEYFQQRNNLTVDGIVGTNTRAKLNAYGTSCSTKWGVDYEIRHWTAGNKPQHWMMNGTAQIWRNEPFPANSSGTQTIGDSGNCPTSFAMIASTFKGMAITPPIVCNYVLNNGLRDTTGTTGVVAAFFSSAANEYNLHYYGTVNGIANIKTKLNQGYLAMVRVVGNSAHSYCSASGATYLVVYQVGDTVKVLNPNYNTQSQLDMSYSTWANASWVKEAHIYGA